MPGSGGPLLSEQWFRVSHLKPQRAPQVQIDCVAYRGHSGVVLTLPGSPSQTGDTKAASQRLRLSAAAYAFYGRCNGQHTVQALWHSLLAQAADDAPTQDELIQLLLQLVRGGWLSVAALPDDKAETTALFTRHAYAFIKRRGYVIPEDVRAVTPDILRHRIGLTYEAEAENVTVNDIIAKVLNTVEVP